ncbi:hypothetical protein [Ideonella sp.]|jgi:putative chitinase|uniref:hypothetical protein n=1 Tax=Ideonella sp. TaxID=1929293 RepID=UPI0037C03D92
MQAMEWMPLLGLGALMGACGQLTRVVAGFAKARREHKNEPIYAQQLVVGLLIGAVSGVLAMLTIAAGPTTKFDTTALLGLAAAGYAGVDFLEGMSGKLGGTAPPADRQ